MKKLLVVIALISAALMGLSACTITPMRVSYAEPVVWVPYKHGHDYRGDSYRSRGHSSYYRSGSRY